MVVQNESLTRLWDFLLLNERETGSASARRAI
jgi:hypothetical protein